MTRTDPFLDRLHDVVGTVDVPELDPDAMADRAVRTVRARRMAAGGALVAVVVAVVVLLPSVADRLDGAPLPGPAATPTATPLGPEPPGEVLTAALPRVEGVVPGVPDGWEPQEIAGLTYAMPPSWTPDPDPARSGPRYQRWVGGEEDALGAAEPAMLEVSFAAGYATWEVPDDAYVAEAKRTWDATVETVDVTGADYVLVERQPFSSDGASAVQVQVALRESDGPGYTLLFWVPDSPRGEELVRGFLGSLGFA